MTLSCGPFQWLQQWDQWQKTWRAWHCACGHCCARTCSAWTAQCHPSPSTKRYRASRGPEISGESCRLKTPLGGHLGRAKCCFPDSPRGVGVLLAPLAPCSQHLPLSAGVFQHKTPPHRLLRDRFLHHAQPGHETCCPRDQAALGGGWPHGRDLGAAWARGQAQPLSFDSAVVAQRENIVFREGWRFSCGLVRKSSAQLSPFRALSGLSQTVSLKPSSVVLPAGAL